MNVFRLEGLRVLLRVAVPLVLGVDLLHSFYFVGCLIKEKHALEAEQYRRQTLHATTSLFKTISTECAKTDFSFWPVSIFETIRAAPLPDLSSLPRPSYELDDEEETPVASQRSGTRLRSFPDEASPIGGHPLSQNDVTGDQASTDGGEEAAIETESIASDVTAKRPRLVEIDVHRMIRVLYESVIPFPMRHPRRFLKAAKTEIEREVRLHLKKSDGYFESKGVWLRGVLHLPYLVIERRSALRFQFRIIPVSQISV